MVKALLKNNWDVDKTPLDDIPPIHTGGYDDYTPRTAQVTVTNTTEITSGGGDTGISAKGGGGQELIQNKLGLMQLNTWATWEDNHGKNPKQVTRLLADHVHDILLATGEIYLESRLAGTGYEDTELKFVTPGDGPNEQPPNTDPNITEFSYQVQARYAYERRA